jgi:hypothetical protein
VYEVLSTEYDFNEGYAAGDLFRSTADFTSSTGLSRHYVAEGGPLVHELVTEHIVGEPRLTYPNGPFMTYVLEAQGSDTFCFVQDDNCGRGGETFIPSVLTLTSISITPHVAAIPEPETWALMLAGLAAISPVSRRRKTMPAK